MADFLTPEERSIRMSKIRGENKKAERVVFRYICHQGEYPQKHYRSKECIVTDIAFPRKKSAVFIDGGFWHGQGINKVIARGGEDGEPDESERWLGGFVDRFSGGA